MITTKTVDVLVIGGSYSGLAAGMALGRARRQVLILDEGMPCNRQTPYSHNFLTRDGMPPQEIATLAREQVAQYDTVQFFNGKAIQGIKSKNGFTVETASGESFEARKLIIATGIRDILAPITGFAECWGISVLHCPYCHGYEMRGEKTGLLGNGDAAFEFAALLSNWTTDLTLFTNGASSLSPEQVVKLKSHHIGIKEAGIEKLGHTNGYLHTIHFKDGTTSPMTALYAQIPFEQQCAVPVSLGCELTDEGYIKTDAQQKTTVPGVFACGDNTTRIRTVANAVATGTLAGMMLNKEFVLEAF